MKKTIVSAILLLTAGLAFTAFTFTFKNEPPAEKVKWLTWQEAAELNKNTPKFLCGNLRNPLA